MTKPRAPSACLDCTPPPTLTPTPRDRAGAYAAAALTDTTLRQARWLLDRLARAHLIQRAGTGRYGMHDQAAGHLRRSLALFRDVGLRSGETLVQSWTAWW